MICRLGLGFLALCALLLVVLLADADEDETDPHAYVEHDDGIQPYDPVTLPSWRN